MTWGGGCLIRWIMALNKLSFCQRHEHGIYQISGPPHSAILEKQVAIDYKGRHANVNPPFTETLPSRMQAWNNPEQYAGTQWAKTLSKIPRESYLQRHSLWSSWSRCRCRKLALNCRIINGLAIKRGLSLHSLWKRTSCTVQILIYSWASTGVELCMFGFGIANNLIW